jgi:hypothetical protein
VANLVDEGRSGTTQVDDIDIVRIELSSTLSTRSEKKPEGNSS